MGQFVRFTVDDEVRFAALLRVFDAIKSVKNLDYVETVHEGVALEYDVDALRALMPAEVQERFEWPADPITQRLDPSLPIRIDPPGSHRGKPWALVRILDLIDTCEYALADVRRIDSHTAELHVETYSYPYGGLNALIGLVEGFGFRVLGVDECGKYEPFATVP